MTLYTTGAVARLFGVAVRTAAKWCDAGLLKAYLMPSPNGVKERRITLESVIALAEKNGLDFVLEAIKMDRLKDKVDSRPVVRGRCVVKKKEVDS